MSTLSIITVIVLFVVIVFVLWTQPIGAPWAPTRKEAVQKMLSIAKIKPGEVVYDLGSGDGRILFEAVLVHKAKAVGIEIDPVRFLWTYIMIRLLRLNDQVKLIYGNFFKTDLKNADIVTCYLLPETNIKLEQKLKNELKPGTRVVSNLFVFPNLKMIRKDEENNVYLYEI